MNIQFRIIHETHYDYAAPVGFGHNIALLRPRTLPHQDVLYHKLIIQPEPLEQRERIDFFGNLLVQFATQTPHSQLLVRAESLVELTPASLPKSAPTQQEMLEARPYLLESPLLPFPLPEVAAYAQKSFSPKREPLDGCVELMGRIFGDFSFQAGFSEVTTPIQEVFAARKGVCQDFAHLGVLCMRCIGFPARYVSGYIETLPPEGEEKLVGADASHAWFSVFFPDLGWVDFDPTNNLLPTTQHITLGWGRDYSDVPPLKGVVVSSGGNHLSVSVDVRRVEKSEEADLKP